MSSLRTIDLKVVDDLVDFVRGKGYVLDFSDQTYSQFFVEMFDLDINDSAYSDMGGSKGKRLKRFLQKVDDPTALRVLQGIWEHRREYLYSTGMTDPVVNAEARFLQLVSRLGDGPSAARTEEAPKPAFNRSKIAALREQVLELSKLAPQPRGYAFESFLKALFELYGLKPRDAFRNIGEQIDGSFVLASETYLLEAKWQNFPIGAADLHGFQGKLDQKAAWARGLFISHSGFTEEGLVAFGRGKRVICMDGLDLYEMLRRELPFDDVLERKVRFAAESGKPFISVAHLFERC